MSADWAVQRRKLGWTGRWPQLRGAGVRVSTSVPGDVESWQHVGGAGSRICSADREGARAAGGGAAAAGEEGNRVGTVGGRGEEGDTCVGTGRHGDAEGSPGGAGPVRRLGRGTGGGAPKSERRAGSLGGLEMRLAGFLELGLLATDGIRHPGKRTDPQASRLLPIPLRVGICNLSGREKGRACAPSSCKKRRLLQEHPEEARSAGDHVYGSA